MSKVCEVLVLGGGSAGFLAAISLKTKLPRLVVTVLRSPEIGIIGVGESTTPYLPEHLHGYLQIPQGEFFAEVRPTWKLGIRFLWGPRPAFYYPFTYVLDRREAGLSHRVGYYADDDGLIADLTSTLMANDKAFPRHESGAPLIGRNVAYHLENEKLVAYLERKARELGIAIREATVASVEQNEQGVSALVLTDAGRVTADLYVDCSGFRSQLLGRTLGEPFESFSSSLYCDRAVVGSRPRMAEPTLPYTTAETMSSGWCWQVEHDDRINRGYVYSSAFQSDADAEAEFRRLVPQVKETRVLKYVSGRYARSWVKNVVAIGNSAGFVEPLEATALYMICATCNALTESLLDSGCEPERLTAAQYNRYSDRLWTNIRNFLAIHYRFNTRLETPFWQACRNDIELGGAQAIVDYYQEYGPSSLWAPTIIDPICPFRLDGYFVLLMGQRVPYRRRYEPLPEELLRWRELRAEWQAVSDQGLIADEALAIVHSPYWQWSPGFYR